TKLVVMASFTFDPQVHGGYASMMGVTPEKFAEAIIAAGADIIGANCGTGPEHMIKIVKLLRAAAPDMPIIAMANAGMPVIENGQTVFKETPEAMASKAPLLVAAGANIIGGCCGTGPAHIAAMKKAVQGG
ncbi:MAG: homocysteine S-methyltransferase family protein, partial [Phycisphaerae bacterium]|nr:homocysteine S-methyltransferase family protein [Phycisphaerae bacterium]